MSTTGTVIPEAGSDLAEPDLAEDMDTLLEDTLDGLRGQPKTLSSKYLYDPVGARLFDAICVLEEYYPTRTELAIMESSLPEMAAALGPGCLVIEYGSGTGEKTEAVLDALDRPAGYVPIDVACPQLATFASKIERHHPGLGVWPICADFTQGPEVPEHPEARRRIVYFPGSTIGNFDRGPALRLLRQIAHTAGLGGGALIGVDLVKDPAILERAYDDPQGVTAAFDLNLLAMLNRELGADFDLSKFRHRATYNATQTRIEMHLDSLCDQTVEIAGERIEFTAGESICTEHSNKYTLDSFSRLAAEAGLRVEKVWTDPERLFSIQYLEVA